MTERDNSPHETIEEALASLPELRQLGPNEDPPDLLTIAAEFSKVLRKTGVHTLRSGTEVVAAVQQATTRLGAIHEGALADRDRAAAAERQNSRLAALVIDQLEYEGRLADLLSEAGLSEWALQVEKGIQLALASASNIGLTPLGIVGEPFDPEAHDLEEELPRGATGMVVARVDSRGFLLNGKLIRRARVTLAVSEEKTGRGGE